MDNGTMLVEVGVKVVVARSRGEGGSRLMGISVWELATCGWILGEEDVAEESSVVGHRKVVGETGVGLE